MTHPITPKTGISIVLVLSIIGGTILITESLGALRSDIRDIRSDLQAIQVDHYSLTRASEIALRTALHNPGSRVIDPRTGEIIRPSTP